MVAAFIAADIARFPQVDGSFGSWTYILSCLYPLHDSPAITLGSVLTLLPVVHKYDFTKLLTRLVAFVKANEEMLCHDFDRMDKYVINWLALAERLQLDELRELCLNRLRGFSKTELQMAIIEPSRRAVREQVKGLGLAMCCEVLAISANKMVANMMVIDESDTADEGDTSDDGDTSDEGDGDEADEADAADE